MKSFYIVLVSVFVFTGEILGQSNYRPDLFFQEEWKEIPAEIPLNQNHVENTDLTVQLYGAGLDSLKKAITINQLMTHFMYGPVCAWKTGW